MPQPPCYNHLSQLPALLDPLLSPVASTILPIFPSILLFLAWPPGDLMCIEAWLGVRMMWPVPPTAPADLPICQHSAVALIAW